MEYLFGILSASIFGSATLVIGISNPIHSILILIFVFFLGSLYLFILKLEYFALLFLIVYVGAIVVLFLFIVMMLEIKTLSIAQRFNNLFYYRSWIIFLFVLEILFFSMPDQIDISPLILKMEKHEISLSFLKEINLYVDYSLLLQKTEHLYGFGSVLFTENKLAIILAALLLLLSMVGSIVMTLTHSFNLKKQDLNVQALQEGGAY
jgi:NADH:ubiquinone oxidoreductase subunit 6 (subunit J)